MTRADRALYRGLRRRPRGPAVLEPDGCRHRGAQSGLGRRRAPERTTPGQGVVRRSEPAQEPPRLRKLISPGPRLARVLKHSRKHGYGLPCGHRGGDRGDILVMPNWKPFASRGKLHSDPDPIQRNHEGSRPRSSTIGPRTARTHPAHDPDGDADRHGSLHARRLHRCERCDAGRAASRAADLLDRNAGGELAVE